MITHMHILITSSMYGQQLPEVLDYLIAAFAIPDSVAGQYYEFNVLMEWLNNNVWVGCDHMVV